MESVALEMGLLLPSAALAIAIASLWLRFARPSGRQWSYVGLLASSCLVAFLTFRMAAMATALALPLLVLFILFVVADRHLTPKERETVERLMEDEESSD